MLSLYQHRSKFELYLEILTQVKSGTCSYEDLTKCMRLSRLELKATLAPLVSEGLLKKSASKIPLKTDEVFSITSKGEQFIELLELAFQFVDVEKD